MAVRYAEVFVWCVLGHGDFEAQNIRWHRREVGTVHDWDSLAWQPEAALAGAASGAFASAGPPTLAPIESAGTCQPELEHGVPGLGEAERPVGGRCSC